MKRTQLLAFVVASCLAVILGLCFAADSGSTAACGERSRTAEIELESRINPNDAPMAGLMMLPGVGIARAQAIISYREQFRQNNSGELAFRNCLDLDNVKGIGPVTVSNLCEHLKFK
jgi:DNA uptake protein ComE-like DNA-binding protein